MKNSDRAVDYMRKTFSCSQAVFSTFSPALGLDEETALKVAGAFGRNGTVNSDSDISGYAALYYDK
jgi:hypothetical protein